MAKLFTLRSLIFLVAGLLYGATTGHYGLFISNWQWWVGILLVCLVLSPLLTALGIDY